MTKELDKLKKENREANDFIIEIAKMLSIETDGLGYDGIQLSMDDFLNSINAIKGTGDYKEASPKDEQWK